MKGRTPYDIRHEMVFSTGLKTIRQKVTIIVAFHFIEAPTPKDATWSGMQQWLDTDPRQR